jgi:hypothetical protein
MRDGDEKHTFDDVNFPAVRPWTFLAQSPKGGPGAAARGHVREVQYDHRVAIGGLRRDANAITPTSGGAKDGPIIGTHNECIAIR